ncbi:MAG: iron(III) transport system substrate-binding protein [Myxococcota bacterium]|jgi:iron(III) transport system substrate-binding protein
MPTNSRVLDPTHLAARHPRSAWFLLAAAALLLAACPAKQDPPTPETGKAPLATTAETPSTDEAKSVTVYCGRSKTLVQPVFDAFTKESGIAVKARYGKTTALANTLMEEGAGSPADVFFAQDAGALGAVAAKGLLTPLPKTLLEKVGARFRGRDGHWVGTSGRARVVVYNTDKLKAADLPDTLEGFTDPKWSGRIGWPTGNASFHAFVTAMRTLKDDAATKTWLSGVQANSPKVYPKNSPAVKAVAGGEIDVAFVNHYYLHRLRAEALAKDKDAPFPAANYHPRGAGAGAMMNVAGVGILASSKARPVAQKLAAFLLGETAQKHFTNASYEYPLVPGIPLNPAIPALETLKLPELDLGKLEDLEATMKLLRDAKVL